MNGRAYATTPENIKVFMCKFVALEFQACQLRLGIPEQRKDRPVSYIELQICGQHYSRSSQAQYARPLSIWLGFIHLKVSFGLITSPVSGIDCASSTIAVPCFAVAALIVSFLGSKPSSSDEERLEPFFNHRLTP
jgi:hypothetical protein